MEPSRINSPPSPRVPSDHDDTIKSSPVVSIRNRNDYTISPPPSPKRRLSPDPEAQYTPEEIYAARRNRMRSDRWNWKVWRLMNMRQRRSPIMMQPMDSKDLGLGAGEGLLGHAGTTEETKIQKRRSRWTYFTFCSISGLSILAVLLALNLGLIIAASLYKHDSDVDPFYEKWGAPKAGAEGLSWYPTDFTRDVLPIACHSHNDYWRRVPLFSAIRAGCIGTEADVWLIDEELFIGHNRASLTKERTFQSLYVNPLVKILENQNKPSNFYNGTSNGVFDEDPGQTLTLLIDVKTSGKDTWPWVLKQLEPLRERNWLTYIENGVVHSRAVTVVGTGNTPFNVLTQNTTYRDAFFDAPLDFMWEPRSTNLTSSDQDTDINEAQLPTPPPPHIDAGQGMTGITPESSFDTTNSYYASVSLSKAIGPLWRGKISPKQLKIIRGQIRGAHRRGLKVRYWDLPGWPIGLRNHVWQILVREGVDLLNVDDLKGASKRVWV